MKNLLFTSLILALAVGCTTPSSTDAPVGVDADGIDVEKEELVNQTGQQNTAYGALDSLNNVLRNDPNNLDVLEERARIYLVMRNLQYAAADVSAVLQMDSTRAKALELWGDLGFASNKTRESRDAWQKCMLNHPENVPCRLKMAELYHIVTEFEKSAELVDVVLNLDPENAEAHFLKGLLMRDALGDTTRALEWFQKAIDLDNDYVEALDMCGVLYSAQGNDLALGYFNRLIELNPTNRVSVYNRGMYFLGKQRWNEALEDFTQCVKLDPADIESLFNLGYIHLQLQMYREARGYFDNALAVQPINHRALYGRGYASEMLGDITSAEQDYRAALGYNPNHAGSQQGVQRMMRAKSQVGQ